MGGLVILLGTVVAALFAFNAWTLHRRVPAQPPHGLSVDVWITTYDEPLDVIRKTWRKGGTEAMTVLRARVTSGNPPTAVQMLGFDITDWAEQGALAAHDRAPVEEAGPAERRVVAAQPLQALFVGAQHGIAAVVEHRVERVRTMTPDAGSTPARSSTVER